MVGILGFFLAKKNISELDWPNPFKGRSRSVHEHSAENIIFGRKWDGRPGIETENASNRSSLVIEICVTPF